MILLIIFVFLPLITYIMKRKLHFIIFLFFIIGLCACTDKKKYRIAVSQCSQDIWRDKLNEELMMSTYLYDNVELLLASADDNDVCR